MAGVAQTHIYRRFAWQAWHLWYWVAPLGRDLAPVTPGAPRHFAWQAWHLVTSRGTNSHLPSFCVAGVALMVLGGALGPGFGACDALGAAALCVAGVAQTHIYCRFAWQAWHKLTSTVVLRGRRGTHGTGWRAWTGLGACDAAALCVAGVAQTHTYCRFAWQAWHKLTSTVVSRGRRGTDGTGWRGTLRGRRGSTSQLVLCSGMSYGRVHHVVLVVLFWLVWGN